MSQLPILSAFKKFILGDDIYKAVHPHLDPTESWGLFNFTIVFGFDIDNCHGAALEPRFFA